MNLLLFLFYINLTTALVIKRAITLPSGVQYPDTEFEWTIQIYQYPLTIVDGVEPSINLAHQAVIVTTNSIPEVYEIDLSIDKVIETDPTTNRIIKGTIFTEMQEHSNMASVVDSKGRPPTPIGDSFTKIATIRNIATQAQSSIGRQFKDNRIYTRSGNNCQGLASNVYNGLLSLP